MRDHRASVTAFIIAFGVIILGADDYGRQRLPPGNIVQVQKDLLTAVLRLRRPYLYPKSSWFWNCFWWLWCNPFVAKFSRWRWQSLLWLLGGRRQRSRRVIRVVETIGYRKTFMEDCVRKGIEDGGCQQVLVIGGGLDTLALRLSELYPQVQFWEVDHPATGQIKQQAIQQMLLSSSTSPSPPPLSQPRTNLHFVPIDLAKTKLTPEILSKDHDYNHQALTVVIIEGVLMYLTEQQVVDLLQHQVADMVGQKSVVAFDFVEGDDKVDENGYDDDDNDAVYNTPSKSMLGPVLTPIMLWTLRHVLHEPWLWGVAPRQFPKFVKKRLSKWKGCGGPATNEDAVVHAAGIVHTTKLEKR